MGTPPDPLPHRPPRPLPRSVPPRPARDYAAMEEAGRRRTGVSILLRRGLLTEAEAEARAILADAPGDAAAQELLGDVQAARGDAGAASASYQLALALEPGRVSAESKFGQMTLRRAEQARRETLGVTYAAADAATVDGGRGGWPAVLESALCPGLGQILQGRYAVGAVLVGLLLLGLGLLALLPRGEHGAPPSPAFWLVTALLAADWVYAVADAARSAVRPE